MPWRGARWPTTRGGTLLRSCLLARGDWLFRNHPEESQRLTELLSRLLLGAQEVQPSLCNQPDISCTVKATPVHRRAKPILRIGGFSRMGTHRSDEQSPRSQPCEDLLQKTQLFITRHVANGIKRRH